MKTDVPQAIHQDDWHFRGARLLVDLLRHDLTPREFKIAEVILQLTYGWKRETVIIPELRYFEKLTDIGTSDVTKVLKSLHRRRVIRVQRSGGFIVYGLNPDAEVWKAMPWATTAEIVHTQNTLREVNGLEPLLMDSDSPVSFFKKEPRTDSGRRTGNLPVGKPTGERVGSPKGELIAIDPNDEFPNLD